MRTRTGLLFSGIGAIAVLGLTLWPWTKPVAPGAQEWCFLCGEKAIADAILNLFLFGPFGFGIGLLRGTASALVGSFSLSALVEITQTGLSGRYPSLSDLVINTLGGGLGGILAVRWRALSRGLAEQSWPVKTFLVLSTAIPLFSPAVLSVPDYPNTAYWGQWTHELGNLIAYEGSVLGAAVGGMEIPDGRIPDQGGVRSAFRDGEVVEILIRLGQEPNQPAHLFAVFDRRQQEIILITVDGPDLDVHRGTVATRLRLDQPSLIWEGALGGVERDTVRIAISQEGSSQCLRLGEESRCDLGVGLEGGWRLLHRLGDPPPLLGALISGIWLFFLGLPAGLMTSTRRTGLFLGLALGGAASLVSWRSPWLTAHGWIVLPLMVGTAAGYHLRKTLGAHGSKA